MKIVQLLRSNSFADGTAGVLVVDDGRFSCATLELPWYNNKPQVSCIPAGTYTCIYSKSPRMGKHTYEVLKVIGRSGIRIHGGNFAGDRSKGYKSHVYGCILLGSKIISSGGQKMIISSQEYIAKFERYMKKEKFILQITWS